jgi:hypothetical protein
VTTEMSTSLNVDGGDVQNTVLVDGRRLAPPTVAVTPNPYPEHEKLGKIKDQSQAVGEFLEWASSGIRDYRICEFDRSLDRWFPIMISTEKLLAEFFGINLDRLEKEKLAMLDELRALNERTKNAG